MARKKRTRESREVWVERVQAWKRSGLSARNFADETGVKVHRLTWWRSRLLRETAGAAAAVEPLAFVEVDHEDARANSANPFVVELRSGERIIVPASFDSEALRHLLTMFGDRAA